MTPAVPARPRLIQAAAALFYDHGLAATGIDAITARAGVAKMSLYNNFASKDDLVCAYLQARHEEWLGLYAAACGDGRNPRRCLFAVFDAYVAHAALAYEHGFRGCGLLNAAAELPAGHRGREIVRRHKEEVETLLRKHVTALRPAGADIAVARLAEHLSYVLEGAVVRAGLDGRDDRLRQAREIAAALIAAT